RLVSTILEEELSKILPSTSTSQSPEILRTNPASMDITSSSPSKSNRRMREEGSDAEGSDANEECCDSISSTSSTSEEVSELPRYFIVDSSALIRLLHFCTRCRGPLKGVYYSFMESVLNVEGECFKCGPHHWSSSPRTEELYDVNLDLATAAFLTGMSTASLRRVGKCMGLGLPHKSTFSHIQESFVQDAVDAIYEIQQQEFVEDLKQRKKIDLVGGGGAPDSSSKYFTYSLMDDVTKKVVHAEVVSCPESTSSVEMEHDACQAALTWANSAFGRSPTSLCTDRHRQIQKMMKTERPEINHVFDAWQIQKRLGKALETVGVKGGRRTLQTWSRYLKNHLLWSIRNCGGSYDTLLDLWSLCLRHVVNDHGECDHEELPEDEVRDTEWIEEGSPAHMSLTKIVNDIGFRSVLKQTTALRFSSELEAFHSTLNVHLPERSEVKKPQFVTTKVKIAVLDHNKNVGRNLDYKVVWYSRGTKKYRMLGVKEKKDDDWRQLIRDEVFSLAQASTAPRRIITRKKIYTGLSPMVAKVTRPPKSHLRQEQELRIRTRKQALPPATTAETVSPVRRPGTGSQAPPSRSAKPFSSGRRGRKRRRVLLKEVYPEADEVYPEADEVYPEADEVYPEADEVYPEADEVYPEADEVYPEAGLS
ncbi:unnamed protein product, partial [Cyprideis torosa]